MTELSWTYMATGVGTFFAVGTLVVVFKAVLGVYWTPMINRVATLILATAIPPLATWAMGNTEWQAIVLAAINGVIVAGSLLGVNEVYRAKISREV